MALLLIFSFSAASQIIVNLAECNPLHLAFPPTHITVSVDLFFVLSHFIICHVTNLPLVSFCGDDVQLLT